MDVARWPGWRKSWIAAPPRRLGRACPSSVPQAREPEGRASAQTLLRGGRGGALPSLAGSERGHVSLRERHRGFECLELLGSWHRPRRASCRARDDPGQVGGRVLGRPRASLEATLMSAEPL